MPIPMVIPSRDLMLYACVARGTTILAEYNSKDADLGAFAAKCLEIAPLFHSVFSHTTRNKTYIFVMDSPFLYFAIFHEKFNKSQGHAFLSSVKTSFNGIFAPNRLDDTLHPYCFQSQFNPVFHQLLEHSTGSQQLDSPIGQMIRSNSSREDRSMRLKKNKKNKALITDIKASNLETSDDDHHENDDELKKEFPVPNHKNVSIVGDGGQHKAKRIWKKHVWVVLSLDLIVCSILFVTWLCICRGFKCIDN